MYRAPRAIIAAAALCAALAAPAAALLLAPAGERTHPHVTPRIGSARTRFHVAFTLRTNPGHTGFLETDYRVAVSAAHTQPVRCVPPVPAGVSTGVTGQIVRVGMLGPGRGWCRGQYAVIVYLERGPYCPHPATGPPPPCPEFATQELETGSATFTVR